MSLMGGAAAPSERDKSHNGYSRAGFSSSVALIVPIAVLVLAPYSAQAANECGAAVGGVVTCSGTNYPSPGISYSATAQTLVLNNANLVARKTVAGTAAVYLSFGNQRQ